jgi:mRNA interferase HigB
MRIITLKALRDFWTAHADSRGSLEDWHEVAVEAEWKNLVDVRKTFPHADGVEVESGNTVTVFNIKGNAYRLVTAIHYNTGIVFVLRIMTHAEYSKDKWKDTL